MKTYTAKLKDRRWVAVQTAAFLLERPSEYGYQAGQHTEVRVDAQSHTFTLASAPHENDLMFATRMRGSEYKKMLDELGPGDSLQITPASGSFTLQDGDGPAIFGSEQEFGEVAG